MLLRNSKKQFAKNSIEQRQEPSVLKSTQVYVAEYRAINTWNRALYVYIEQN